MEKLCSILMLLCICVACKQKKTSNDTELTDVPVKDDLKATTTTVNSTANNTQNLSEGGRHLVTLSYGINMVYLDGAEDQTQVYWTGSSDKGKSWKLKSPHLGKELPGVDRYPALDANSNGSYIAYIEEDKEGSVGYVVHLPKPFEDPSIYSRSKPLTSPASQAKYSFISASKAASSVVYGWTDVKTGEIKVGVSNDGTTFPETRAIAIDKGAVSGPAVSIEANYVALTYQSVSPQYQPANFTQGKGTNSFPVWMESIDGGKTWSEPKPLLGLHVKDFPKTIATKIERDNKIMKAAITAAGGSNPTSMVSSGLVWEAADISNPLVFMISTQAPLISSAPIFGGTDIQQDNIGIVSFKPSRAGGEWTHVISNKGILDDQHKGVLVTSINHKYSALPKTKVRAVVYTERRKATETKKVSDNIVVIASINGGQSFDQPFTFKGSDMGLQENESILFDSSPCLRSDEKGDVWVDIAYSKLQNGKLVGGLLYASLPIGINVKEEIIMLAQNDLGPGKW